jgi:hypothetical protein
MCITQRTCCVLCKHGLIDFYKQEKYPLLTTPTISDISDDIFVDLYYKICSVCRCVQLTSLVDPTSLYTSDNKNSLTSIWKEHHTSFVYFIKKSIDITSGICEIGGGSSPLYKYFNTPIKYSVLDIYDPINKDKSIEYTIGNCEIFTNYTNETIMLSHTFEHLYNPRDFLKNISNSCVQNVFISVPNFKDWLHLNLTVSILFTQHTFYFEKEQISCLFNEFGFKLQDFFVFKNHSLFFFFQRAKIVDTLTMIPSASESLIFKHFSNKSININNINLERDTYIMPSFYIGQQVYYYLNNSFKNKVIGFLDNDINKINKRLYGTPLLTYSPEVLKKKTNISIILVNTPYYQEIKEQLLSINSTIHIISINILNLP